MKKGFTLIELLAVIVILAIIALIAVPIVVNIINDSKKESLQRSIDLYVDHAQKAITKYQMTHPDFNPKECTIEDKKLTCDGTEIEVEMKGQTPQSGTITIVDNKLYYDVVLEGKKYILEVPPIPATGEDYKGYYADVDGDGEADGVIYADLAHASRENAKWGPGYNNQYINNGEYSYEALEDLKEYTISKNKHNGKFGEKEIISVKPGSSGNSRFYVMALEDFTTEAYTDPNDSNNNYPAYTTYYWYKNAYGKMPSPVKDTSTDFGTGYTNTGNMIRIWNNNGVEEGWTTGATQDKRDIWKHIKDKYNSKEKWYIPSKGEWSAFADYFGITSNYDTGSYVANGGNYNSTYGLSSYYWSSSQGNAFYSWSIIFDNGGMDYGIVYGNDYVRLGATF